MNRFVRAIQRPDEAFHFVWRRAFSIVGHEQFTRFIVLAGPRTGSTLLISYLNSHPNVYARREIFQKLNGSRYQQTLDRIFCKQPPNIKAVGFKIFYSHPFDGGGTDLWDALVGMHELHVIHLKRKNPLRTLLSHRISSKTNLWNVPQGHPLADIESRKIDFAYEELLQELEKMQRIESEFYQRFENHPRLPVHYEDLVNNAETEFRKVTGFLGLSFTPPKTQYIRVNPESLSRLLVNYEELRKKFEGSQWAQLFEERESL